MEYKHKPKRLQRSSKLSIDSLPYVKEVYILGDVILEIYKTDICNWYSLQKSTIDFLRYDEKFSPL